MQMEQKAGVHCNVTATKTNTKTGEKTVYKNHNMILDGILNRAFTHGASFINPSGSFGPCRLGTDNTATTGAEENILGTELATLSIPTTIGDSVVSADDPAHGVAFGDYIYRVQAFSNVHYTRGAVLRDSCFMYFQSNGENVFNAFAAGSTFDFPGDFELPALKNSAVLFGVLTRAEDMLYVLGQEDSGQEEWKLFQIPLVGGVPQVNATQSSASPIEGYFHAQRIHDISPNDKYIASALNGSPLKVFEVDTEADPHTFSVVYDGATEDGEANKESALFSPDGAYLISGGASNTSQEDVISLYTVAGSTITRTWTFAGHDPLNLGSAGRVYGWSEDSTRFVCLVSDVGWYVCTIDGATVTVELMPDIPLLHNHLNNRSQASAIVASNTGDVYIKSGSDAYFCSDTETGYVVTVLSGYSAISHFALSPTRNHLFRALSNSWSRYIQKRVRTADYPLSTTVTYVYPAGVGTGDVGEAYLQARPSESPFFHRAADTPVARVVFNPVIPKGVDDQLDIDWEIGVSPVTSMVGVVVGGQRDGVTDINWELKMPPRCAHDWAAGLGGGGINSSSGDLNSTAFVAWAIGAEEENQHVRVVKSPGPLDTGFTHPWLGAEPNLTPGFSMVVDPYVPGSFEREFRLGFDVVEANDDIGGIRLEGRNRILAYIEFNPPLDKVDTYQVFLDFKFKMERV